MGNSKNENTNLKNSDSNNNDSVNFDNNFRLPKLKLGINKKLLIISIAVFTGLIFFILKNFVFNQDAILDNGKNSMITNNEIDNLNQKELELKEKELILREKELELKSNQEESEIIKMNIKNWINDLNNRNTNIGNYYDNIVNYYSWDNSSRDKVIGDKLSFYKNWDSFNLSISNSDIKQISDDRIECSYDKTINSSNISNGKVYDAKVRSRLIFKKNGNKWLITDEDDLSIYYKNKNW